jgi:hypothetical protein
MRENVCVWSQSDHSKSMEVKLGLATKIHCAGRILC